MKSKVYCSSFKQEAFNPTRLNPDVKFSSQRTSHLDLYFFLSVTAYKCYMTINRDNQAAVPTGQNVFEGSVPDLPVKPQEICFGQCSEYRDKLMPGCSRRHEVKTEAALQNYRL